MYKKIIDLINDNVVSCSKICEGNYNIIVEHDDHVLFEVTKDFLTTSENYNPLLFIILIDLCEIERNNFTQKKYDDFFPKIGGYLITWMNGIINFHNMGIITREIESTGPKIILNARRKT